MRRFAAVAALVLAALAWPTPAGAARATPADLAASFRDAVVRVNEKHAKAPGASTESELAAKLPRSARGAIEKLLLCEDSEETREALATAGEAALDLDLVDVFASVRERLGALDPVAADVLGRVESRERFLVIGTHGVSTEYLAHFADVLEAVLAQYDATFGFAEWSKVPGKKLRVRAHRVDRIERPPHFAPQFPFHSEIDFPVVAEERLTSPTPDGKFMLYGLCHELGHVIAMWGDRTTEEDHHAWAHYTGVVIVEQLAASKQRREKLLDGLRDVRWRSLTKVRDDLESKETEPGRTDRDAVLAVLVALHDAVGPEAIGAALNRLDDADERLRINRVRYYTFDALRDALLATVKGARAKKTIRKLL